MIGNGGSDAFFGMGGNDRFYLDATPTMVDGGSGTDTLYVQKGSPVVLTDSNFMNVERVVVLNGGSVDMSGVSTGQTINSTSSGTSNTTIVGSAGNDRISGGSGVDDITGGADNDQIFAGTGAETFHYDQVGFGRDLIIGADLAKDTFDVSALGSALADLHFTAINGGMDTQITGTQDATPGDAIVLRSISVAAAQAGNYTF